ncbi:uncharacterized protein LOC134252532 [Saccostrea cucullata]|uniref:uncharacterized protein LOC134252532 n=1 Tax=Saccostrea cuccullata TaxID=36930 RepID=UPI002ED538C0
MCIVKTLAFLCSLWTSSLVLGIKQEVFPQSAYRKWEDAESSCRKDGLGLLVNMDKLTSSSTTELEDSITDTDPYWTGGYRLSVFYWNFGCYTFDSVATYIKTFNQNDTANSVVQCAVFCREERHWIGLVKGFCYCLNAVPQSSSEVSQCTVPCPGHKQDTCGDEQAMSVYKLLNETETTEDIANEQLKNNEQCTYLEINGGRIAWKVDDCAQTKMVLCQNRTKNGIVFMNPHYTPKDWDTAHQDCRDKKLEMAVVTLSDTLKRPFNSLPPSTRIDIWTALYRHVLDRWTDVDMKENPKDCLAIQKNNYGVLDRAWQPCYTQNKYVCLSEGASPTVESAVIGTPSPTTVSTEKTKQTTPTLQQSTILTTVSTEETKQTTPTLQQSTILTTMSKTETKQTTPTLQQSTIPTEQTTKQTTITATKQPPTEEVTTSQLIQTTKLKLQPITTPTTQQTIPTVKETTQTIPTTKHTTQQTTFTTTVATTPQTTPTKPTTEKISIPTTIPMAEVTTLQNIPTTIKLTTQETKLSTIERTTIQSTEVTTFESLSTTDKTTQQPTTPVAEQTFPKTEVTTHQLISTTEEATQEITNKLFTQETTQTAISTSQELSTPITEVETTFKKEKQTFPTTAKLSTVLPTEQTTTVQTSVRTTKQINISSAVQQTSLPATTMDTRMSTTRFQTPLSTEQSTTLKTEQTFTKVTKIMPTEGARRTTKLTKAVINPSTKIIHGMEFTLSKSMDSIETTTKVTQSKTTEEEDMKGKSTLSNKESTSIGNASDIIHPNPERSSEHVSHIPTTELIVVIVIFVAVLLLAVFVFLQWFIRKRRKSVTLNRRTSTEITFKGEEEMLIRSYSEKSANLSPKPLPRIDINTGSLDAIANIPDSHKNLNQSKETLDIPWIDASRNTLDDIGFPLDTEPRSENIGAKSQSAPELDRIGDDSEEEDDSAFMKTFSHPPIESEI